MARHALVRTPLGDDIFKLSRFWSQEALSECFEIQLELLSEDPNLDIGRLLGQLTLVELELPDERTRQFSGVVSHFALVGSRGQHFQYKATLRPWFWLLSQNQESRTFKDKSIPEVVETIFREHGFTDFQRRLTSQYQAQEFIVQYRESDAHFISRILEREGIYFFFVHANGTHTFVLADSICSHEPSPGYEKVPYYPPQQGQRRERDHLDSWRTFQRVRPAHSLLSDFNFERPRLPVRASAGNATGSPAAGLTVFEHPGLFQTTEQAQTAARVQLERQQADVEQAEGSGNVGGLYAGCLFRLESFPRDDQNKEYLVTRLSCEAAMSGFESGSSESGPEFRCTLSGLDARRPYRPAQRTPKPRIEGPQTAIVVGPEEQEIWTDQYGRVRVQFHWDHRASKFEDASCWVRVSQAWAGAEFGAMHIPRVGQEVIVDFLEGDPDRPIIVGRVYNAANMPPYALPTNHTQSGIRSRSVRGMPNQFNEIRFEDKPGHEDLFIQAERTQTTLVKASQSISVGGGQSVSVGGDQSNSIGNHQTVSVGNNQTVTIHGNRTIEVGYTLTEKMGYGRSVTVAADRDVLTAGAGRTVSVTGSDITDVDGECTMKASLGISATGRDAALDLGNKAGGTAELSAAARVVIHVGGSSVTLSQSGEVTVEGTHIVVKAKNVELKGDANVNVSGVLVNIN